MQPLPNDNVIPRYAILTKTWGVDYDEVTFNDLTNGTSTDKSGYEKIRFCAEQAKQDSLDYFWIDTYAGLGGTTGARRSPDRANRCVSTNDGPYQAVEAPESRTMPSNPLHCHRYTSSATPAGAFRSSKLSRSRSDVEQTIVAMVNMCGSFLTLREDYVYIIHQSARDFLLDEAAVSVFPSGAGEVHRNIFSRSIEFMSKNLQRNVYQLDALEYPVEQVQQPRPDPLLGLRYSCIY